VFYLLILLVGRQEGHPAWYRLTWVVLEKGPLNGRVQVVDEFVSYRRDQESTVARVSAALEQQRREMEERVEDRAEAVERVAERLRRRELELETVKKSLGVSEDETRRLQELLGSERARHGMGDARWL